MKKIKWEKLLFKTLFFVSAFGISAVAQAVEIKFSGYAKLDAIYDVDQPQGDLSFANQLQLVTQPIARMQAFECTHVNQD